MEAPTLNNVQGLIARGYKNLPAACYLLLEITQTDKAKAWLQQLVVQSAANKPDQSCMNLALTYEGCKQLRLSPQLLAQFSREFQEGMSGTPHRQRILGDHGDSAPEQWQWGGPYKTRVHLLLMLFAANNTVLKTLQNTESKKLKKHGLNILEPTLLSTALEGGKEHFGFQDGIAQPWVEHLRPARDHMNTQPENTIETGEILLGYPNQYGQFTERPLLGEEADEQNFLPNDLSGSRRKDFGRDGSYLVFRQLNQNVKLFWNYMNEQTDKQGDKDPYAMTELASKMMGRWPSGTPLVNAPRQDEPTLKPKDDAFNYIHDTKGLACPLGAHIRRANPRGSFGTSTETHLTIQEAFEVEKRHRIIRRGRPFGKPLASSLTPQGLLKAKEDQINRGLYFICFNANINRQFEFLQQAWINSKKFQGGYDEADPIIGDHKETTGNQNTEHSSSFSIPDCPVRRKVHKLPRFVTVQGGEYFFMPSIGAIRYLGHSS